MHALFYNAVFMSIDRRWIVPVAVICALGAVAVAAPTWQAQASGVTGRLRGISAVSAQVAWASGQGGTVLRTIDGGRTWEPRPVASATRLDFRDIDAFSDRLAYALSIGNGDASRIYKTTDGGAHWDLQFQNTDPRVFLDAMAFADAEHAVVIGDSVDGQFVILTTGNGGHSWVRAAADPTRLPAALPNEGAFAASGSNVAFSGSRHVWIGTSASRVLRSSDGGRTWAVSATPIPASQSAGVFSIAFRDQAHGVIVGGDYQKEPDAVNNAAVTTDGGVTWTLVKDHGLSGFRSAVSWLPGSRSSWVAVGPAGCDRSADDGRTWSQLACDGFDAVSFAPRRRTAWASGARGKISRLEWPVQD
jgi:photosystem II stability/assembly factor-like uncharacterized protein